MKVGSTAATPLSTPLTLMSTISCQSSVFIADSGALGMMPAFRKITSTLPKLSLASFTMASLSACFVTSSTW